MEKYRIVKLIHNVSGLSEMPCRAEIEYVIQKKNWLGRWKEVMVTEISTKRISHKTYEDAEAYMILEYMGNGRCEKIGVEYHYIPQSFHFC